MTYRQKKHKPSLENDFNFKVMTKEYSQAVLGYRLIVNDEKIFILNSNLNLEDRQKALQALMEVEVECSHYGLLILQKGYIFYVNPNYTYNSKAGTYLHEADGVKNLETARLYRKYKTKRRL